MQITLEGLVDTKVDADILKMAPDFIRSRQQDLQLLKSAYEHKDYETIAKVCHKLKGFSTPFGFTDLETLAIRLGEAAKSKDIKALDPHYAQMESYITKKTQQLLQLQF